LQALIAYFDLLGIDKISDLPKGDGNPPGNDPQVYVGAVHSATHHVFSKSFKPWKILRSIISPVSSLLLSCSTARKTLNNFNDDTCSDHFIPIMDAPPTESGVAADDCNKFVHLLIEITTDGDVLIKADPDDKDTSAPRGYIYTRTMITEYIKYSDACQEAASSASLDAMVTARKCTPAGYETLAKYYNDTSQFVHSEFSLYNPEMDHTPPVSVPVSLKNFGFFSNTTRSGKNHSQSSNKPHGKKPYAKHNPSTSRAGFNSQPSFTSLLQQTHNLRGIDGLLADLLVTSTSQHTSRAKMSSLHFGVCDFKRRNPKNGNASKNSIPGTPSPPNHL
jgi:hypothetical protein